MDPFGIEWLLGDEEMEILATMFLAEELLESESEPTCPRCHAPLSKVDGKKYYCKKCQTLYIKKMGESEE